jgi:hypothetical protein
MCVDCFCTRSPSKTPKDRNPVAIDPGIEGATSFKKLCDHQRNRSKSAFFNFLHAPWPHAAETSSPVRQLPKEK